MYNLSPWPSPGSHQQQGLFSWFTILSKLTVMHYCLFCFLPVQITFCTPPLSSTHQRILRLLFLARFFHTTSLIHSPFSQSSSPLSADVKTSWVRVSKQNLRQSWTVSKSCTFIARLCFSFLICSWTSWSPFIISFPEQASIQNIAHSSQHLHISIWVQDSRFLQKLSR